jgi:hypothetical protein
MLGRLQNPTERSEVVPVDSRNSEGRRFYMNINLSLGPLVSLIAGILILVMPRLLNYIIALYLIVIGLLGLFGPGGSFHSVHFS